MSKLILILLCGLGGLPSSATLSAGGESVTLLECEVMLGSPQKPYQMRVSATRSTFLISLPQLLNTTIPTTAYTLDMTLAGLGMDLTEFRKIFHKKDVLLIGEGLGVLLPALLDAGARVKAVDPLYGLAEVAEDQWNMAELEARPKLLRQLRQVQDYLIRYDEFIFPGVATPLPFPNDKFDYVISHMMLNNFSINSQDPRDIQYANRINQIAILESVRVLRSSGRAIHVVSGGPDNAMASYFQQILNPVALAPLKPQFQMRFTVTGPKKIKMEFQPTDSLDVPPPTDEISSWRLMVTRP